MMMMGARMRSQTRWVVERRTAGMMLVRTEIKVGFGERNHSPVIAAH